MTDASSKIDVRRLKVGDLLLKILVHCALLCLVFLVLGRDQRPSNPATPSSRDDTMCLTRLPEVVNVTISQECIAKDTNCVAMRMNKP